MTTASVNYPSKKDDFPRKGKRRSPLTTVVGLGASARPPMMQNNSNFCESRNPMRHILYCIHHTSRQTVRYPPHELWRYTMANLNDLTPRELEILQLIITGKTNKAIANQIYISKKTVEFHLDNIYSKIGVRSRLMATVWALKQGIGMETREIPR